MEGNLWKRRQISILSQKGAQTSSETEIVHRDWTKKSREKSGLVVNDKLPDRSPRLGQLENSRWSLLYYVKYIKIKIIFNIIKLGSKLRLSAKATRTFAFCD